MATDSSGNDQIERKLIGIGNEVFSTGALGEGNPITHARIRTTPHTARTRGESLLETCGGVWAISSDLWIF